MSKLKTESKNYWFYVISHVGPSIFKVWKNFKDGAYWLFEKVVDFKWAENRKNIEAFRN